ncbi:DUF4917 family protein [Pseudomonas corrugata]|uniref:DUF4917 family protein n=1 Tax=Pseudomonas corrugata TaxID=47879 RepID=UPI002230B7B0|nr:DUF4917 family protein [Pseudomonas corrugata]UZD97380.1 DUF4917 family protein [Pseudomonas corrugata]
MPAEINDDLLNWADIHDLRWHDLLLGNGFSINIHAGFWYDNLKNVACRPEIGEPLLNESRALFDAYDTTNFEDVLKSIYHAMQVDECLGLQQMGPISGVYENIKNSLASAVNYAHVPEGFSSASLISDELARFNNVYTTNYDLIPYWAIMSKETYRFKDLFWGEAFDSSNAGIWGQCTAIHYLHGGLHLVEDLEGRTIKRRSNGLSSLRDLFDLAEPDLFPLFISEGHSNKKLAKIMRSDYLSFCFSKFTKGHNDLVVLGHSLHSEYDQHIVDAIKHSNRRRVAVSVWPGLSPMQKINFKGRLVEEMQGTNITLFFFDSTTHPLTSPAMRNIVF